MKRAFASLLCMVFLMLASCAAAQELPSTECFSPGALAAEERIARGETVHVDADLGVSNAMYIKDPSVLSAVFSALRFGIDAQTRTDGGSATALTVYQGIVPLLTVQLAEEPEGTFLQWNGALYHLDDAAAEWAQLDELESLLTLLGEFTGGHSLERLSVDGLQGALLALEVGTALGDYAVTEAFTAMVGLSDDGLRRTRLQWRGAVAKPGDAAWQVAGECFRPGTKAPKDTLTLTLEKDADNSLLLSYNGQTSASMNKKETQGTVESGKKIQLTGKLGGYKVAGSLNITQKNAWTLLDNGLQEKISVTAKFSWEDKTPGRAFLRLNKLSFTAKDSIVLNSLPDAFPERADAASFSLSMGGETVLEGTAALRLSSARELPALETAKAVSLNQDGLTALMETAVQDMAAKVYSTLPSSIQKKIAP